MNATGSGGTMNVTGNALEGDILRILSFVGPAPVFVSDPNPVTINVTGITPMDLRAGNGGLSGAPAITVNLAAHSEWVGGFATAVPGSGKPFLVQGAGLFDNTTSSVGGTATIDSRVIGSGVFNVTAAHGKGQLEFAHWVSAGQTVSLNTGYGVYSAHLQVDDPASFHAQVQQGFGETILEGIQATSYSLQNDLLSLFNGNTVVDTLRFAVQSAGGFQPHDFGVSQVGGAVVVHSDNFLGGTALGVHA
jgi:hypothetical protein